MAGMSGIFDPEPIANELAIAINERNMATVNGADDEILGQLTAVTCDAEDRLLRELILDLSWGGDPEWLMDAAVVIYDERKEAGTLVQPAPWLEGDVEEPAAASV